MPMVLESNNELFPNGRNEGTIIPYLIGKSTQHKVE